MDVSEELKLKIQKKIGGGGGVALGGGGGGSEWM